MTAKQHPTTSGTTIKRIRQRYGVTTHAIEREAPQRRGRSLNHAIILRIESGETLVPDPDTLHRIAEGIHKASAGLARTDRLALFEAAFATHLTFEAAKFALYYLYMLSEQSDPLVQSLETLREQMLAAFPELGEDPPPMPQPKTGVGRRGKRGPERERVNLRTANGFEAVQMMAEFKPAHYLRVLLLPNVIEAVIRDWTTDQMRIGEGPLARAARQRKDALDLAPGREWNDIDVSPVEQSPGGQMS